MKEHILIVDDEKEIADLLELYLGNDGFLIHKFYNGADALECIRTMELDLAILDVMLPDIDGFRICQKIREEHYLSGHYADSKGGRCGQDYGADDRCR